MYITAFFTQYGIPQTTLTPTIIITKVSDGVDAVLNADMTSNNYGFYYYNFLTYIVGETYTIRCDGGSGLPDAERYTYTTWCPESMPVADFGS
jgi:hypothetical protein